MRKQKLDAPFLVCKAIEIRSLEFIREEMSKLTIRELQTMRKVLKEMTTYKPFGAIFDYLQQNLGLYHLNIDTFMFTNTLVKTIPQEIEVLIQQRKLSWCIKLGRKINKSTSVRI